MKVRYDYIRKAFITLVPVIALFLVMISTIVYYYFNEEYLSIYDLISNTFGYGCAWLPVYYYAYEKYHLCFYTKVALHGLTFYSFINIAYYFTSFNENIYFKAFEAVTLISFSIITIYFILKTYFHDRFA